MRHHQQNNNFNLTRTIKKFFLSAFVVVSFLLYALHKPNSSASGKLGSSLPQTRSQLSETLTPSGPDTAAVVETPVPPQENTQAPAASVPTNPPPTDVPPTAVPPTAAPTTQVASSANTSGQTGQYKDGTYTGPEVDAQYGLVQVQAVIQNGKISNVQALEYPTDRRTSAYINSIAVPDLQQEAMQAQSANVDLITGATLTSQAFQMSLQAALNQAQGGL